MDALWSRDLLSLWCSAASFPPTHMYIEIGELAHLINLHDKNCLKESSVAW